MTFELKELPSLRTHFDNTKKIILERDKKKKIQDLADPRKYEFLFLENILAKLEVLQATKKSPHISNVFYGAMYVTLEDIKNNLKMHETVGLLNGRLEDLIGSKPEHKPNLFQKARFLSALNGWFLNEVFGGDSRAGFANNHALVDISTQNLKKLIDISYKLEKEAQKAIIDSLTANGKTIADASKYQVQSQRKSPASATTRFVSLKSLSDQLDHLMIIEQADKNVSKIDDLKQRRANQIHFLTAIRDSLKTSTIEETEKVAILAGAMQLIRKQIFDEYNTTLGKMNVLTSLQSSKVYTQLTAILDKPEEMSTQDVEALISSTVLYIRYMTIESNEEDKKVIRSKHIFSDINNFDLKGCFHLFNEMICSCRMDSLANIVSRAEKKKPATSFFSALGSYSFLGGKKAEEEATETYEHNPSVNT